MKKINKKIIYGFSFMLVCLVSVFSIININNKNNSVLKSDFVIDIGEKNYRKVYLLDESNTLVPLSVEVIEKEHLADEIYTVVSYLRDLEVKGFNGVLAKDIKINKIELKNGVLNIDFSSEFLNYNKDLEEKILEALTWSVLDFNEVKGLTISVDGKQLKKMPLNGFELPQVLDKSIGINKHNDTTRQCMSCENVVLLYEKKINDDIYYIPVTRKISGQNEVLISEGLKEDISVMSGLRKIDELNQFIEFKLEEEVMSIEMDESSLVEENLLESSLYELLMVMFFYNDLDYKVDFRVNDDSVAVNGYNVNEEIMVNSIKFNEIKL